MRTGVHQTGLALAFASLALPGFALDLSLPAPAEITAEKIEAHGSVRLPTGPFAAGVVPTRLAEGALTTTAFRIAGMTGSTLELVQGLQGQVQAASFTPVFSCEAAACGGYDFRYGAPVLPEPDMHVNLGDFRYVLAEGPAGELLALMVSRSGETGFVQVTQVGGAGTVAVKETAVVDPLPKPAAPRPATGDLLGGIEAGRAVVLEDLVFPSGSAALAEGDYASLGALADWLKADPARKLVLVGHTDASGDLAGNIKLSRLRAESVRQVLLFSKKISPEQVQAEGIGPLSPRVSNLTEDGRRQNRRVEVMTTSTALLTP